MMCCETKYDMTQPSEIRFVRQLSWAPDLRDGSALRDPSGYRFQPIKTRKKNGKATKAALLARWTTRFGEGPVRHCSIRPIAGDRLM